MDKRWPSQLNESHSPIYRWCTSAAWRRGVIDRRCSSAITSHRFGIDNLRHWSGDPPWAALWMETGSLLEAVTSPLGTTSPLIHIVIWELCSSRNRPLYCHCDAEHGHQMPKKKKNGIEILIWIGKLFGRTLLRHALVLLVLFARSSSSCDDIWHYRTTQGEEEV